MHGFVRQAWRGKVFRKNCVEELGLISPRVPKDSVGAQHSQGCARIKADTYTNTHTNMADGKASWGRLALTLSHFPFLPIKHTARRYAHTHTRMCSSRIRGPG